MPGKHLQFPLTVGPLTVVPTDSCLHWQLSPLTVVRTDSCPIWQLSDLTVVRSDSCLIWQLITDSCPLTIFYWQLNDNFMLSFDQKALFSNWVQLQSWIYCWRRRVELGGSVGIISQGKCHFCSPIILILIHLVGHAVVVVAFVYLSLFARPHSDLA